MDSIGHCSLQRSSQLLQIFDARTEPANRLIVRIAMYGDVNLSGADIDTSGAGLLYWPDIGHPGGKRRSAAEL